MKISCDVILDLIPLVKDGVASDASVAIVNEHINNCANCKEEFNTFETKKIDKPSIKDEKIILSIKRRIFITQLTFLILGAITGVALSNSAGMFYNLIIMPVIGGVSLIALKRKWYVAPIAIFVLTFLWQTISGIVFGGFDWQAFHGGLYYSIIYTFLVGLGIIIAALLKFAFKKEE